MEIKWDISGLPAKTREFLRTKRDEHTVKALLAANERQALLAKHFRNNPPQAREGFGGQTMAFDPVVMAGLRRQAGPGAADKDVQRYFSRKFPGLYSHRHTGTRLQVGYGSTPVFVAARDVKPSRPGVKFCRVYSERAEH